MARLFTPITIRDMTLKNRIVLPPMCQYSATDGVVGPWHHQHYGCFAASGVGLIVLEATGVLPEGRISNHCLGLWNDTQEAELKKLVENLKSFGDSKISIQLGHAGRKGSTSRLWEGARPLVEGAWTVIAPSAIPFDEGFPTPVELDEAGMTRVKNGFVDAAKRALNAGFDTIELHGAHGYLLHEFLSPFSNHRTDTYGGSLENRMRFPLEVIAAVRAVWPAEKPLGIRISATEWVEGGFDLNEAIIYAKEFAKLGIDYVGVSSGGNVPKAVIPLEVGYQVPLADAIRKSTGLITRAVGLIATPEQAEQVLVEEKADLVAIGRGFLNDPRWVWHAAKRLGVSLNYAPQFLLAQPGMWRVSDLVNSGPEAAHAS